MARESIKSRRIESSSSRVANSGAPTSVVRYKQMDGLSTSSRAQDSTLEPCRPRAEAPQCLKADAVLEEPDRAVAQQDIGAAGVIAAQAESSRIRDGAVRVDVAVRNLRIRRDKEVTQRVACERHDPALAEGSGLALGGCNGPAAAQMGSHCCKPAPPAGIDIVGVFRVMPGGYDPTKAMLCGIVRTFGLPVPVFHSPKAIVLLVPSVIAARVGGFALAGLGTLVVDSPSADPEIGRPLISEYPVRRAAGPGNVEFQTRTERREIVIARGDDVLDLRGRPFDQPARCRARRAEESVSRVVWMVWLIRSPTVEL